MIPEESPNLKQLNHNIYGNHVQNIDVLKFLKSISEDDFFDLVIVDPPYNIGKDFGNNSDNLSMHSYVNWSKQYIDECIRLAKPDAPIYIYGFPEILSYLAVQYPISQQRWLSWHYTNKTVPSSKFWQRSYESILCLWKAKKPILNIDDIREGYTETFLKNSAGKVRNSKYCRFSKGNSITVYKAHDKGALPRDVIKIPALAGGSGSRERVAYCKSCNQLVIGKDKHKHTECNLISHPTQKPIKLTEKLIKATNPKKNPDSFCGSGSECFVAKKMNVEFYATELNEDYVNLANKWVNTMTNKLEEFNIFLSKIDLEKYRNKYSKIKLVELDLPKNIQAIKMLYTNYWDNFSLLDFDDFYSLYFNSLNEELEEFRVKQMFSEETFYRGLPARIYRTWASLLTQIQGGYVAQSIYPKVVMSAELDYQGIDMRIYIDKKNEKFINIQIKKETVSREVRTPWINKNRKKEQVTNIIYEVAGGETHRKNGEIRVPYQRWLNRWQDKLIKLDNGFIIFLPGMFQLENIKTP